MAQYLMDFVYSLTNCMCCFPTPALSINHRSFKILRLLGEGGFSYVYLVQDTSGTLYALKKIRCPFGQESLTRALSEVNSYKQFPPSPLLIPLIDSTVVTARDDTKTVYILLPYYRRGNLQDLINANLVNKTWFSEGQILRLFKGICQGLGLLHNHRVRGGVVRSTPAPPPAGEEEEEGVALMEGEGDGVSGGVVGELRPFAHRDIKPGNVMISDDGETPVLMDFGSIAPSPIKVTNRSQAVQIQDEAAEHSTLPYRAPELFDVKTGSTIDTSVDVWSLGCVLYALAYHHSPFELSTELGGGSLALAISSGDWKFPAQGQTGARAGGEGDVGEKTKEIIRRCLEVESEERPTVKELEVMCTEALAELSS